MVRTYGIGRYEPDVEATVYFSCLESMNNVAKYAQATRSTIDLSAVDGIVVFTVEDDGVGFDPATRGLGTGLQGIVRSRRSARWHRDDPERPRRGDHGAR